jgi:hypothetical protein
MRGRIPTALLSMKLRGLRTQNYYKEQKQRRRKEADGGVIEQLVHGERAVQPRLGYRKLFHLPGPIGIGRGYLTVSRRLMRSGTCSTLRFTVQTAGRRGSVTW